MEWQPDGELCDADRLALGRALLAVESNHHCVELERFSATEASAGQP